MAEGHKKRSRDGDLMSKKANNLRIKRSHKHVNFYTVTFKLIGSKWHMLKVRTNQKSTNQYCKDMNCCNTCLFRALHPLPEAMLRASTFFLSQVNPVSLLLYLCVSEDHSLAPCKRTRIPIPFRYNIIFNLTSKSNLRK